MMAENNKILQWGNHGPILVFLHYFGGSAQSWRWVVEKLSDDYRCIAITLPGFDGEPAMKVPSIQGFAEYVQKQITSLGLKTYTLIGHSMGGKIALQIAANACKETIQQLILVAPSPPTTEPTTETEKESMLHHTDPQVAEKLIKGAIRKPLTEDQYVLVLKTQLITDPATWRWWILKGMNHSIADNIKSLELPITVLASKDDPVITSDVIKQRVVPFLNQPKLITTSGVGHLSPLEEPGWIAEQIQNLVTIGGKRSSGLRVGI